MSGHSALMRIWLLVLSFFASFAAAPVAAQEDESSGHGAEVTESADKRNKPDTLFEKAFKAIGRNRPLQAVTLLERGYEAGTVPPDNLAQFYSLIGAEREALELALQHDGRGAWPGRVDLSGYRAEPAIAAIIEAARDRRVVMINEAHHISRHRAFGQLLMRELAGIGFTHFGAEAFCSICETLTEHSAPTVETGHYTQDPVYGDFVRDAVVRGYELVSYEQRPGQESSFDQPNDIRLALREQAQADNLAAFLKANPEARLFVFVGYGHHMEKPLAGRLLMGGRFKRMTGIDPLTINQRMGTASASKPYDSPVFRSAERAFKIDAPIVLENENGQLFGGYNDITVFHPRSTYPNGRPDWLSMNGYRQPHTLIFDPMANRTLVRAFVEGEPENAIPMDQVIVPAGAESVTLMLPTGEYRLVRQTEAGENLPLGEINISSS